MMETKDDACETLHKVMKVEATKSMKNLSSFLKTSDEPSQHEHLQNSQGSFINDFEYTDQVFQNTSKNSNNEDLPTSSKNIYPKRNASFVDSCYGSAKERLRELLKQTKEDKDDSRDDDLIFRFQLKKLIDSSEEFNEKQLTSTEITKKSTAQTLDNQINNSSKPDYTHSTKEPVENLHQPPVDDIITILQQEHQKVSLYARENELLKEKNNLLCGKLKEASDGINVINDELKNQKRQTLSNMTQNNSAIHKPQENENIVKHKKSELKIGSLISGGDGENSCIEGGDRGFRGVEIERLRKEIKLLKNQLEFVRNENSLLNVEVTALQNKLAVYRSLHQISTDGTSLPITTSLCANCFSLVGLTEPTHAFKSRKDELARELEALTEKLEEIKEREAKREVKLRGAIDEKEEARVEMTKVYIENERLKVNLEECEKRVKEFKKKNCGDVIIAASEREKRVQELDKMNIELMAKLSEVSTKYERMCRESGCEGGFGLSDNMKIELLNLRSEGAAMREKMKRMKKKMEVDEETKLEEISALHAEIKALKLRLSGSENDVIAARVELVKLHTRCEEADKETEQLRILKKNNDNIYEGKLKFLEDRLREREIVFKRDSKVVRDMFDSKLSEIEENKKHYAKIIQELQEQCMQLIEVIESNRDNENINNNFKKKRIVNDKKTFNDIKKRINNNLDERVQS